MSKTNRGKNLNALFARGRGTCPVCKRGGVKLLYEQEISGEKTKVCKICRATLKKSKEAS